MAIAVAIFFTRHRRDRFWLQATYTTSTDAAPRTFYNAVQDPEYFLAWREFSATHAEIATPTELLKAFPALYENGFYRDEW